jgi:hypothetical protein
MKLRNVGLTLMTAMLMSCGGKVVVIPVSNADPVPPMEAIWPSN